MTDEEKLEHLIVRLTRKGTLKWRKAGMPQTLAKAVAIYELAKLVADLVDAQRRD